MRLSAYFCLRSFDICRTLHRGVAKKMLCLTCGDVLSGSSKLCLANYAALMHSLGSYLRNASQQCLCLRLCSVRTVPCLILSRCHSILSHVDIGMMHQM